MCKFAITHARCDDECQFADLIITCAGRRFYCEQAVVCSQSEYFQEKCLAYWHRTSRKSIDLPNNDPHLINLMLEFLYTVAYESKEGTDTIFHLNHPRHILKIHLALYAIGDEFGIPTLCSYSATRFYRTLLQERDPKDVLECIRLVYESAADARPLRIRAIAVLVRRPRVITARAEERSIFIRLMEHVKLFRNDYLEARLVEDLREGEDVDEWGGMWISRVRRYVEVQDPQD
ncbi:MAG: hypothetical protein Q9210_006013 [Variospora velana]